MLQVQCKQAETKKEVAMKDILQEPKIAGCRASGWWSKAH